jgi:hypothetical protein
VGWPPKLLRDQSTAERVFALALGPILLGAVCGWLLGATEIGYIILTTLAALGGYAAGYEHDSPRAGMLRGLWGGSLFALTICEVHRLLGEKPLAEVPDPIELIVFVFALIGAALGAFGAARRRKHGLSPGSRSSE